MSTTDRILSNDPPPPPDFVTHTSTHNSPADGNDEHKVCFQETETDQSVVKIQEFCPNITSIPYIEDVLVSCFGNVESALNLIYGTLSPILQTVFQKLMEQDSDLTSRDVLAVMIEAKGDYDDAYSCMKRYRWERKLPKYRDYVGDVEEPAEPPNIPETPLTKIKLESCSTAYSGGNTTHSTSLVGYGAGESSGEPRVMVLTTPGNKGKEIATSIVSNDADPSTTTSAESKEAAASVSNVDATFSSTTSTQAQIYPSSTTKQPMVIDLTLPSPPQKHSFRKAEVETLDSTTKQPIVIDLTLPSPPKKHSFRKVDVETLDSTSKSKDGSYLSSSRGSSFKENAKTLYESLGRRKSMEDCETALNVNNKNLQDALKWMEEEDSDMDGNSHFERGVRNKYAAKAALRGVQTVRRQVKRRTEMHPSICSVSDPSTSRLVKKQRLEIDKKTPDGSTQRIILPPLENATDWLDVFYPESSKRATLIFSNGTTRETLPRSLLYKLSPWFRNHYDKLDGSEPDENINMPRTIDPEIFDLVFQCLVTRSFSLRDIDALTLEQQIGIILSVVEVSNNLEFPDPGLAAVETLRSILIEERNALTTSHVRRAYAFRRNHPIQKLLAKAVVQQYMRRDVSYDEAPLPGSDDEGEENSLYPDEGLDSARLSLYFGYGQRFRYIRETRETDETGEPCHFLTDIGTAIMGVTNAKDSRIETGRRKGLQGTLTFYVDPLDGGTWSP